MRILHVISSLDPAAGGPQEGTAQLCTALLHGPYKNEIATLDAPGMPWAARFPAKVHAFGPARFGYRYSPHLAPWLHAHARDYDAVIVHGLWQFHGFSVWRELHRRATPYYVYTHGMLDPWFKRTYPLKHAKKWLYWPWAEYRVLRDARAVLFTCEDEMRLAPQSFPLYRVRPVVAGYGTAAPAGDPAVLRAAFYARFPALANRRLLLFLGRIHPKKGCDLLLEGFANVARQDRSLHLVFAGPDHNYWQTALAARAAALGISERLTWTGMLTQDIKWGALHAADIFALVSHQENFGVAVAEALACGLPVLISNKVNIWREIETDGVGLVDSDDVVGATRLLQRWLALPTAEAGRMRAAARATFARRFQIDAVAQRFIEILQGHHRRG